MQTKIKTSFSVPENRKFFAENWRKLAKFGENWRKLAKKAEILIIALAPA
jgi:hypothetical protein